jgi:hypothetical protein
LKTIGELQGVFDTGNTVQNYISRQKLPFKDELDELAALFVIAGLDKNPVLTTTACIYIVCFVHNYPLKEDPYGISVDLCIPLIVECQEESFELYSFKRLRKAIRTLGR